MVSKSHLLLILAATVFAYCNVVNSSPAQVSGGAHRKLAASSLESWMLGGHTAGGTASGSASSPETKSVFATGEPKPTSLFRKDDTGPSYPAGSYNKSEEVTGPQAIGNTVIGAIGWPGDQPADEAVVGGTGPAFMGTGASPDPAKIPATTIATVDAANAQAAAALKANPFSQPDDCATNLKEYTDCIRKRGKSARRNNGPCAELYEKRTKCSAAKGASSVGPVVGGASAEALPGGGGANTNTVAAGGAGGPTNPAQGSLLAMINQPGGVGGGGGGGADTAAASAGGGGGGEAAKPAPGSLAAMIHKPTPVADLLTKQDTAGSVQDGASMIPQGGRVGAVGANLVPAGECPGPTCAQNFPRATVAVAAGATLGGPNGGEGGSCQALRDVLTKCMGPEGTKQRRRTKCKMQYDAWLSCDQDKKQLGVAVVEAPGGNLAAANAISAQAVSNLPAGGGAAAGSGSLSAMIYNPKSTPVADLLNKQDNAGTVQPGTSMLPQGTQPVVSAAG